MTVLSAAHPDLRAACSALDAVCPKANSSLSVLLSARQSSPRPQIKRLVCWVPVRGDQSAAPAQNTREAEGVCAASVCVRHNARVEQHTKREARQTRTIQAKQ